MFSLYPRLVGLACGITIASLGFTSAAQAFTIADTDNTPKTDAAFNGFLTSGQLREVFVPGMRSGNNNPALNGERELEILDPIAVTFNGPGAGVIGSQPVNQSAQRTWQSGTQNSFTVEYDPGAQNSANRLKFTVGNNVLSSSSYTAPVTEIFLRVRSGSNAIGTFSTILSDLKLNGQSLQRNSQNVTVTASCQRTGTANCSSVQYLRIQGITRKFTLTGNAAFSWAGSTMPSNSNMMFQVKAMAPGPRSVPAPGMLAGFALAGAGTLWRKLRQAA